MKKFEKPTIELVEFSKEDTLVTSGCEFGELDCDSF